LRDNKTRAEEHANVLKQSPIRPGIVHRPTEHARCRRRRGGGTRIAHSQPPCSGIIQGSVLPATEALSERCPEGECRNAQPLYQTAAAAAAAAAGDKSPPINSDREPNVRSSRPDGDCHGGRAGKRR